MRKNPLNRVRQQNRWLRKLCSAEPMALRMCVPIDLAACEPEFVVARTAGDLELFNYWRVVLSSEPQNPQFCWLGRSVAFIVRDRVSGGILGVIALTDPPPGLPQLNKLLNWHKETEAIRIRNNHRIIMMRRCLPVYEFGQMTGGKLLTLMATSRDVIRLQELRYSFQYLLFAIRTLHGKGSQYNRLHQRGVALIDVDENQRGFYAMELRKKAVPFLRGEAGAYGKTATYSLADQIDYWRERWLKVRMTSLSAGSIIHPDPERYRLSNLLSVKKMTLEHLVSTEADHGVEPEEEAEV